MGILDLADRVGRNAWRVPGLGAVLERDYERSFLRRPPNRFRGVYRSFAEAEASIPAGQRVGYDHDEMQGMYRHRMEKANQSDYAVLFWLKGLLDDRTVVFDFGGHVGVAYHAWRRYLAYPAGMRWICQDVPAITREGEALTRERPSEHLSFTGDVADARGCTIFLAAGALQYVEEDGAAMLRRIGHLPAHVILNKMPVYDGEPFVTVQSTGRAFHPYQIYNREQLVAGYTALGYRLVDDWQNREQSCHVPFTRDKHIDAYSGFYFTR